MRRTLHIIATGVLWGVAMFINDGHAAQPLTELQREERAGWFLSKYVQTKKCMRSTGKAAHARGDDADRVQYMMLSVCGSTLYVFMRQDMSDRQAVENMMRIARTSYYEDVLGTTEPPYFGNATK